jgi:hypothetical protein
VSGKTVRTLQLAIVRIPQLLRLHSEILLALRSPVLQTRLCGVAAPFSDSELVQIGRPESLTADQGDDLPRALTIGATSVRSVVDLFCSFHEQLPKLLLFG